MKNNRLADPFPFSSGNVYEYPQGRPQPTTIVVRPDGVVTFRTMVRADMYTVLDVR